MARKLRRNDVIEYNKSGWITYGRVWRRVDDDHVLIITCMRDIEVCADEDLMLSDYPGRWDTYGDLRQRFPIFRSMPTLRRLKQHALKYNDVWKNGPPSFWGRPRTHKYDLLAPFTDKQIARINDFQQRGQWRAETCWNAWDRERNKADDAHDAYKEANGLRISGQMVATRDGLVCPVCNERRTWTPRHTVALIYEPKW